MWQKHKTFWFEGFPLIPAVNALISQTASGKILLPQSPGPAVDERDALLKTHRELELCYAALAKQPRGFLSSAEAFVCLGFVRKCFLQNREQRLRFPLVVPLCLHDNEAGRGQARCVGNHVTKLFSQFSALCPLLGKSCYFLQGNAFQSRFHISTESCIQAKMF